MKRAVSISIGSSKRNKAVEVNILGETVQIERIGTDGDMEKARALYEELDGKVDAFGVGGALLGLLVGERWYGWKAPQALVRNVRRTPVLDGTGLKNTLERRAAGVLDRNIGDRLPNRRALATSMLDRWGLGAGFIEAGYETGIGDVIFSLGLPILVYKPATIKLIAAVLLPAITRMPFEWFYPVGKSQEQRTPKHEKFFNWASVIIGDCHFIHKYAPNRLDGKVIVTNTTTEEDRAFFRDAGVKHMITTTPVLEGRSFGTNMMEAAICAAVGRTQPVDYANATEYFRWMDQMVDQLHLEPQFFEL